MDNPDRGAAPSANMAVLGQLAAGIAHEINTPAQYVSDNIFFLQDAFDGLHKVLRHYNRLLKAVTARTVKTKTVQDLQAVLETVEIDYLLDQIPQAISQSLEGMTRITQIVEAMRDFSHPGLMEKTAVDINQSIRSTIMVTRNIWKRWADLETDLDESLPNLACQPGEINQVLLNLIVNAADAVADARVDSAAAKGVIRVQSLLMDQGIEIRVSDTGTGIPESVQARIFEPFFTTKAVGKGTGQGLAISAAVIANHGGSITFETQPGSGTTFVVRLPLAEPVA